jgi:O-acetyl-ADP-ribose deacetylase (regulator of RNase III)
MGKGIALQFKKAFPQNFAKYAAACKKEEVAIGKMFVTEEKTLEGNKTILNFISVRLT